MFKVSILVAVCLLTVVAPRDARSTSGWLPINEKTVDGTWVSFDPQSGEVYRLRIQGTNARLVITAGPTQSEFVFVSEDLAVKNGRLSARMEKHSVGMALDVVGEGRADTVRGIMTLRMKTVGQRFPPWKERTIALVKECCGSIVDVFAKNERRARALMGGSVKANESEVAIPAVQGKAAGQVPQTTKKCCDAGSP